MNALTRVVRPDDHEFFLAEDAVRAATIQALDHEAAIIRQRLDVLSTRPELSQSEDVNPFAWMYQTWGNSLALSCVVFDTCLGIADAACRPYIPPEFVRDFVPERDLWATMPALGKC